MSRLEVFFVKSLKLEEIKSFQQKLNNVQGIQKVTFVNNADAWTSFKSSYDHLNLESYITENPLPHSLVLKLDRYQDIKPIILYLKRYDSLIDDIVYGGELADRVDIFRRFMSFSGWALICLLVLASLFIIVNTIRLTVMARNEEIVIMRLVGATDLFIKCPFLMEGFIIGVLGSFCWYYIVFTIISHLIEKMPFFPFISDSASLIYIYGFVLITGAIIGTFGTYISVTRSLKKG